MANKFSKMQRNHAEFEERTSSEVWCSEGRQYQDISDEASTCEKCPAKDRALQLCCLFFVRKKRNQSAESGSNDGFGSHFLKRICFWRAVTQCALKKSFRPSRPRFNGGRFWYGGPKFGF